VLFPMPLLAPVITTTLSVMFDFSILFSLFQNLLFTASCTPLNDGPCDSDVSSTNEVKKANTSVHVERFGTCPAHRAGDPIGRRLCRDREVSDEASLPTDKVGSPLRPGSTPVANGCGFPAQVFR